MRLGCAALLLEPCQRSAEGARCQQSRIDFAFRRFVDGNNPAMFVRLLQSDAKNTFSKKIKKKSGALNSILLMYYVIWSVGSIVLDY